MSGGADVSIVMANYNGARYLTAAIQSVVRQTFVSWELVIVDDASTDDSLATAHRAAGDDSRIRIVTQSKNQGPAAARNRALDLARGRWIAIFDSDDIMLPRRLEFLLESARANTADIVADNLLLFSERSRPRPFLPARSIHQARWIGLDEFIASNCLYSRLPPLGYLKPLIRADIVRDRELRYDETLRIGEDYNFLARLMAGGCRLRLEPAGLYLYRKHESSVSHRLRAADIIGLIAAERRFAQEVERLRPASTGVLKRRRRTLGSLLAYDEVIAALKRRDFATAGRCAVLHPRMWPLLTMPVSARLKRLAAKFAPRNSENRPLLDDEQLQALSL
ncbi:MAG TPA: glycosyltransferase [Stellaceae bacterium]|jgi:succinoglycan biosynthesis protein ExoO